MIELLQSSTRDAVGAALDGLQLRHQAITANVANAETPGYKAIEVTFEDKLKQFLSQPPGQSADLNLQTTKQSHFIGDASSTQAGDSVQTQQMSGISYRADSNGVDIDREMARMAQASERYLALSQMESKMFKSVRSVITSGG